MRNKNYPALFFKIGCCLFSLHALLHAESEIHRPVADEANIVCVFHCWLLQKSIQKTYERSQYPIQ